MLSAFFSLSEGDMHGDGRVVGVHVRAQEKHDLMFVCVCVQRGLRGGSFAC